MDYANEANIVNKDSLFVKKYGHTQLLIVLSFVLQVKIAILQYLQGLIGLMDPSDFTNSGGILLSCYNLMSRYNFSSQATIDFV